MYIAAGKKKLEETRNGELVELQRKAQETGLAEDVQAAKDLAAKCDRFEKKNPRFAAYKNNRSSERPTNQNGSEF